MDEPELHVRGLTPPMPVTACESGQHIAHPGLTCDEQDELRAAVRAYIDAAVMQALHKAVDDTVYGNRTGDMRGFLTGPRPEPTPAERAFAILEPHLHNVPLYRPRGRILP